MTAIVDRLTCSNCKEEIQGEVQIGLDGTYYCPDCYAARFFRCGNCGGMWRAEDRTDHEGNSYCADCFSELFSTCDSCGGITESSRAVIFRDEVYCSVCEERNLSRCEDCGELYNSRDTGWGGFCVSCGEEHFICDGCGDTFSNDDYGEDGLCLGCSDDRRGSGLIHEHYYTPELKFHPNYEQGSLYLGVELETDNYDDLNEAAEALTRFAEENGQKFYLKEDASLRCGIEIVSHPATLEYHVGKMGWPRIQEICDSAGGKSQCSTCGIHVHFNVDFFDDRELAEARLLYFFEKFWTELFKFSRRMNEGGYFKRYCGLTFRRRLNHDNVTVDISDLEDETKARNRISEFKSCSGDRYMAVNITNENTIEIRLFNGTLKSDRLFAALELVDIVARLVKKYSTRRLQRLTWFGFVQLVSKKKYPYLKAELERLELTGKEQNKCA